VARLKALQVQRQLLEVDDLQQCASHHAEQRPQLRPFAADSSGCTTMQHVRMRGDW
jgi:hypothetical protein